MTGKSKTMTALLFAAMVANAGLWEDFVNPPEDVKIGCYYYWVDERVDPEGVRKDLEFMKENGITRAFLATDIRDHKNMIAPDPQTLGDNAFMSERWWENLRTAFKTAGELGIEMGFYAIGSGNRPGVMDVDWFRVAQ